MKARFVCSFACVLIMLAISPVLAADQSVSGKVVETGMSGVILGQAGGAEVKYWTGRESKFSPANWRPMAGDEIKVDYYERTSKRSESQFVAVQLTLIKADPDNAKMISPVTGTVREVGRSGIIVELDANKISHKFDTGRRTAYKPRGYRPAVGDKVTISFTRIPSRWTNGMTNVANAVERQ